MTPFYPKHVKPLRDGCYIIRQPGSDCQHFCRWDTQTSKWYSAGSVGRSQYDIIGWSGADIYEWRGLAQEPKQ